MTPNEIASLRNSHMREERSWRAPLLLNLSTVHANLEMLQRKLLLLHIEDLIQVVVLLPGVPPGVHGVHGVPPGVAHAGPVAALTGAPVLNGGHPLIPLVPLPPPYLALTETPPVGGRSCQPGNISQFLFKFLEAFKIDQTAFIIRQFPYLLGLASILGCFC